MQDFFKKHLEKRLTYMGSCDDFDASSKVIIGIPMDITTSFRSGTNLAPFRVREVSEGLEEYSLYQDKSLAEIDFYDAGDLLIPLGNLTAILDKAEKVASRLLSQDKMLYTIGGEHLITLPLVKAYKAKYPDLVVVQMDAHADLREEYLGEQLSHATVMYKVVGIIGQGNLYQLGIRSGTKEEISFAKHNTHLYLDQLKTPLAEVKGKIGSRPVYITLDIDVLDPAFAPGTGTPEPAGFGTRELFETLLSLGELNVVGFDIVEISPPNELGDITSILGAKVLREVLLLY